MSALEFRRSKGWGVQVMPDGDESISCHLCRAAGKQHPGGGSKLVFLLGKPFLRVCLKCEKDVHEVWDGALDANGPAA